jgi:hypothetical protein
MLIALALVSILNLCYYPNNSDLDSHHIEGTYFKAHFTQWQRIYYKVLSRNTVLPGGTSFYFKDDTNFDFHFCSGSRYSGKYKLLGDTIFIVAINFPFPKKFYFQTSKNIFGELTDTLTKKRYIFSYIKQ